MIIECESCGTRFNLADAQVPVEGARVHCSKCHHRFRVLPSGEIESSDPSPPDTSIDQAVAGSSFGASFVPEPQEKKSKEKKPASPEPPAAPAEAAQAPKPKPDSERSSDDPDLENPEFLLDEKQAEPGGLSPGDGPGTQAFGLDLRGGTGAPQTAEAAPGSSPEATSNAESHDSAGSSGSAAAAGPGVFGQPETAGSSAGISLTQGSAETAQDESYWLEDADEADVREQVFGIEQPDSQTTVMDSIDGFPVDVVGTEDEGDSGLHMAQSLGGVDGYDPPVDSPSASSSEHLSCESDGVAASEPVAVALRSRVADRMLGSAAVLVGVLLVLGAGRLIWQGAMNPAQGPDAVRGAGWIASEIETVDLTAGLESRVLVVRGVLTAESSSVAPRVEAVLLDRAGSELPTSAHWVRRRLESKDLNSEVFSRFLDDPRAQNGEGVGAMLAGSAAQGSAASGFTLLILDPPAAAQRFRIDLLPGSSS